MSCLISLADLSRNQVALAGGKGAALGELYQAGLPVPNGFVITAQAYDAGVLDEQAIITAFETLNSPYVAVRSSATTEDSPTAAWAGQLESYIPTTRGTLLRNIQKCWNSLGNQRVTAYRERMGLAGVPVKIAVVVQKMVQASAAGIAFSAHPVTGNTNQVVIEAVHGLGEAAVGGHVTPETFILHKQHGRILQHNPSRQHKKLTHTPEGKTTWQAVPQPMPVLTPRQLRQLLAYILAIETHFGYPCDIEWAIEGGDIFIVQSRPITA